jgi:hypothetical protein
LIRRKKEREKEEMKEEQQRLLGDTPTGPQTYSPWNVQFLMMYALGMLMTVGFSVILPALFDFLTIEVWHLF